MKDGENIKTRFSSLAKWLKWLWNFGGRTAQPSKTIPNNKPQSTSSEKTEELTHDRTASTKHSPKILMIGWELPPHNSGGLGVACYDLCESLSHDFGAKITFILPYDAQIQVPFMKIKYCDAINLEKLASGIDKNAYPRRIHHSTQDAKIFGNNLISQVEKYAEQIKEVMRGEMFDVIHAHDWLSLKAGIKAKQLSGKPLIVHIHSTEFDRAGGDFVYKEIADIEQEGVEQADKIIAVSNFTKEKIIKYYHIDPDKIEVVHNGVSYKRSEVSPSDVSALKKVGKKIVLFVGRITIQKGPDYFLAAAKKVSEIIDEAVFIMVGTGDMEGQIIEQAAGLGLSGKVFFTGFVNGEEKNSLYRSADLYVMPSVSEPFGIVALESLINRTPVLISKQSGVSETLRHALKVDFWDTDEMANMIVAVLKYKSLRTTLRKKGAKEVKRITWDEAAKKCVDIYEKII